MKENNKKVLKIVGVVAAILCLIALIVFVIPKKEEEPKEDPPKEEVKEDEEEDTEEQEEIVGNPIDFAYWKSVNEDVYAYIQIADTNVDYPILQSATDDSYYLNHTIDHVEGYPGSIYTERVNAKDFSDFNTLIYGHDMKDGSMFKHLHKFEDKEFFDTHDTVMIYTENEIRTYRVYAAVIYDDRHIMYHYDNDDIADRKAFIQSLQDVAGAGSFFREGMTIDENSKLITMSTCISGKPNNRYIVVAAEVAVEQVTQTNIEKADS